MLEFLNAEFLMIFLIGLNESFSQIHAEVLLSSPLPIINKVFSLTKQEERQRSIGASPSIETIALMMSTKNKRHNNERSKKKDIRICSNSGYKGHIVDNCCKLHGYPLDIGLPIQTTLLQFTRSRAMWQAINKQPPNLKMKRELT